MRESQDRPLYVVEGFFASLRLWQHGIRRVVASMVSNIIVALKIACRQRGDMRLLIEHESHSPPRRAISVRPFNGR